MKPNDAFQTCCLFMACLFFSILAPNIKAQPQAIALHSFSKITNFSQTNSDGNGPVGNLLLVGTNLYGTAVTGGAYSQGTLFALSTNGSGFTNLHNFGNPGTTDGQEPNCALIQLGNKLFGTLSQGGVTDSGGIFSINLDGSGYNNFYTFSAIAQDPTISFANTNKDGAFPWAGLVAAGNTLYGVTVLGGKYGNGTIFSIRTNGTGFTNLHDFAITPYPSGTNNEGAATYGALIISGNMLYGAASHGGTNGDGAGTVFAMSTNGTGFMNLHNFTIDVDGNLPLGSLLLAGNALYGTTSFGGPTASGTIFKVNTDGTDFAILHQFTANPYIPGTNTDGAAPHSTLILSGDTLVGTSLNGGYNDTGTIFTIKTNGNDFAAIYQFSSLDNNGETNFDGAYPSAGVILAGNTLYGTSKNGGYGGRGTVFALALPITPSLGITETDTNILISWPTAAVGYDLESCTDLSAANWTSVTTGLTVVDTNFVFASPASESAFFRLRR
jgi:uncharacterized repeat protein (TIGR03803 family)